MPCFLDEYEHEELMKNPQFCAVCGIVRDDKIEVVDNVCRDCR